jgi:hypothetical protein
MVGEMAKPLFDRDAGPELSEQGRDGLEGVFASAFTYGRDT